MENVLHRIQSPHFDRDVFKGQLEQLAKAAEEAKEKTDFDSAHNPEVLRSIEIVEHFLRKRHRLCYGGQAINAHLPKKHKIYNPQLSIPDYDFFTPDQKADIEELSKDLVKAGFEEVSAREGMHEGTKKLYVNFIPVADLTSLDERVYNLLSEKAYKSNGISYMDANTLRMLMYLELSRPKGEVERWEKVFERLLMINTFSPVKSCDKQERRIPKGLLAKEEVEDVIDFIISEKRVFAGADLAGFYRSSFGKDHPSASWIFKAQKPIFFYSPDLEGDTKRFINEFKHSSSTKTFITRIDALGGDLIPQMTIFLRKNIPFLVILNESACHAYYNVPVKHEKFMRIATMDTLITLYFALSLLKYKFLSLNAMECLAKELVEISYRARTKPEVFPFPFISLTCSGHQTGLPSLIRAKVARIKTEKKKAHGRGSTQKKRRRWF